MTAAVLRKALLANADPRFADACREMMLALKHPSQELRGDGRRIPRAELLAMYRGRRDLKRSLGTPWPVLEDLAEAIRESTSESLRIYYVHRPGRMNTVFVNGDRSICACIDLPTEEKPGAPG